MITTNYHADGICVIAPQFERLTAANADSFKTEVLALIQEGRTRMVIDFARVSMVDSSGIGALVGLLKKVGNRGEIAISALSDNVAQVFRITRMDRVFKIFPDSHGALSSMDT
jgi:anti-sigma B factor antagonist